MTKDHPAEAWKRRLREDLKVAMLERRSTEVKLLRVLIAAIDNAEAVAVGDAHARYVELEFGDRTAEVRRRRLDIADIHAVLERERAERLALADDFRRHGRADVAREALAQAAMIERYFPG